MASYPTQYEFKWAGCSLIWAQLLWILVGIGYAIYKPHNYDVDLYDIHTEQDIIDLHDAVSSKAFRAATQWNVACYWLAFPLYLIAIYTIKKFLLSIYVDTKFEMWIYVMENAYLFSLLVTNIIAPALSLVLVSYEWSIHEYTADNADFVATGYYFQAYALLVIEELYDSIGIADGLFLVIVTMSPSYPWCATEAKFKEAKQDPNAVKYCRICTVLIAISLGVAYLVSLFRFAENGFFSLNGGAAWLPIYGILYKFVLGAFFVKIGFGRSYEERVKQLYGREDRAPNDHDAMLDHDAGAQMETIDVAQNKEDNV